ncbi:uncharacterized protein LOC117601549 [Osmia lignaria lignaria]|uniref:uncharacterized protein LOC117601549 n=1 Tax=Osmia lignaria lignaria TaxID=1437193 RepID=UPI00402B2403
MTDQKLTPHPLINNEIIPEKNDTKINILERSKRSSKRKRVFKVSPEKFYRHPNLSFEEQQKQFNSSNHEFSSSETRKPSYVPVFMKCEDTGRSEADDMVKSTGENLKNIKENEEKDRNDSMASERSEDPSDETKSKNLVEHLNKTYINIRDHQKNIGETTDIPEYDPNKIPYVEVPDYSDIREESLDEEDRKANKKKKKQQNVDFVDPSVSLNIDELENNNEYNLSKGSKNDSNKKIDNSKRNKNESRKDSKQKSNDSEKSRFKELAFDDESDRESQGDPEGQGKSTSPIIFDINEYRKPFDLDEFLKDDPIMKKLESLGKETLSKYGKNGKRVSGDFNESESDNAPEKRSGTVEEREDGDYSSKLRQSNDFAETLTERHDQNNDTAKEPRNKVNQGSEGSKLLRFLFKDKDEYLTKHLEDDIIRNFRKDEKKENGEIGVSRLNEDIDKGIETGDESGLVYKNFWSLEFKSPQKKVDMEAQERKK